MRVFYLIVLLFVFVGCSSKNVEYIIPTPHVANAGEFHSVLGVAEVKVPEYLNSDKILVEKGTKLYKIDAHFASIPSKMLTQNTIEALKRSLHTPNVFLYPWEFKATKGYILRIYLDEFIYKDGSAVISGSYFIKKMHGNVVDERNFRYAQVCGESSEEIVKTLSILFGRVLEDISRKIARR